MASHPLPALPVPADIRQRYINLKEEPTCGLTIHILEAGVPTNPLILLLHGFPELAYTYRHLLAPLAAAGYHVVAPDARGYGRTTGWDTSPYAHVNLSQFTQTQLILDNIALLRALGHGAAALVVGHDFGATAASACALARPDLFRAAVFMSHVPKLVELPALAGGGEADGKAKEEDGRPRMVVEEDWQFGLAQHERGPLRHYQWYNSLPTAAHDWENPPQGMEAFLRGYVYLKSHVWHGNRVDIGRLTGWTAEQLARMPGYYIMPAHHTMPTLVADLMQSEDASLTNKFLSDAELAVYVHEFTRTGFQGMLNWYRSATDTRNVNAPMAVFAGRKFVVPVLYVGGDGDWGNWQRPGALEALESGSAAAEYRGTRILEGCGHWPQTERPEVVCREIVRFLEG